MMRKAVMILAAILLATPSIAALNPGAKAPDFSTQGALAGKAFPFSLSKALKKGPVVLYFFPAAFTLGCTLEANQFAEMAGEFKKQGATIIGVAADNIAEMKRFSATECRNKFAVAVATPAMIKGFDVVLPQFAGRSNRTSYVIAPNGQVVYAHSNPDYRGHVTGTLQAVKDWKIGQRRK
jgi:peroxiredoxin Q/BCP